MISSWLIPFNGPDTFTYRVSDGDGELTSGIATVTLDVTPVNDPPVAVNDEYSVDQGESLFVPTGEGALANDDDPDADELTVVLAGLPEHGTVALNADGSFLYTPQGGFVGVDKFRYQATDGELTSEIAMVEITVGSRRPADLTGDGFVDFDDLTILLAHWDQMVSAGQGNLVDPLGTKVNFQDLTLLLAAWTGPGPVAAPQAAVTENPLPTSNEPASDSTPTRRTPSAAQRRIARRPLSQRDVSPLRRLQATDRAMADYQAERGMIFARRIRRGR